MLKGIPGYRGCYMRDDDLPKSGSYVLNLDSKNQSGTHWVSIYNNEYFDSYGLPSPEKLRGKKLVNKKRLQYASDTCGEWAVLYIILRSAKLNPYKICYEFFPRI